MKYPLQESSNSLYHPVPSLYPSEMIVDPFRMVVDSHHGDYCRSVENVVRERIHREEEQKRLEAFMRAANAD